MRKVLPGDAAAVLDCCGELSDALGRVDREAVREAVRRGDRVIESAWVHRTHPRWRAYDAAVQVWQRLCRAADASGLVSNG